MVARFVVFHQAFAACQLSILITFTGAASAQPPVPPLPKESTVKASRLVAEALKAEARGDAQARTARLREAVVVAPDYAPAHWHLGQVNRDDRWMTIDQQADQATVDGRLAEYRKLRSRATNNPKHNLALARWCEKNQLEAERRFHLAGVMRAVPNHPDVIRGLGLRRVRGRLMSGEQIEMLKRQAQWKRESSEIWKPRVSRLMRLARSADLDERAEAEKQFLAIDDPKAIEPLRGALSMTDARHPVRVLNTKSITYAAKHQRNLLLVAILRDTQERVVYSRTFFRSGLLADVAITFEPEPRFWWKWWQDYNELYLFNEKPIYEKTFSNYYDYDMYSESMPVPPLSSCFVRGTLVPTKAGPETIENIRLGDQVLSQDPDSGELTYKTVAERVIGVERRFTFSN